MMFFDLTRLDFSRLCVKSYSCSPLPYERKKAELHICDFDDVTLGSSAISFQIEPDFKKAITGVLKTRDFPSPPHDGFGLTFPKLK